MLTCPSDNRTKKCDSISGDNMENCNYQTFDDIQKTYYWNEWVPIESNKIADGKFSVNALQYSPNETKTFRIEWETPILKTENGWGSSGNWSINPVGWWNGSWFYRRPITISNTAGNLTNYQIMITRNLSPEYSQGKINNTCDDVRFSYRNSTTGNETEITNYWIEKCNFSSYPNATFWVNVSFIENNTNTTLYMYYGNSNAQNKSNVTNTFVRVIGNLSGAWNFDEGNVITAYDQSGNSNNGTVNAVWGTGRYGSGVNFSSNASNNVTVPDSPALKLSGNMTIDAWAYYVSGTYLFISSKGIKEFDFYTYPAGGVIRMWRAYEEGGTSGEASFNTPENSWVHIAAVANSTGRYYFRNGTYVSSANAQDGIVSSYSLGIGNRAIDSLSEPHMIDEFHLFNRSLTDAEISDLYNYRGYATPEYPNKLLMRKSANPEPTIVIGDENQTIIANESEGNFAIEEGIADSFGDATIYSNQQVYVRYTNDSQNLSRFDRVIVYGNQTWTFNYVTDNENFTNMQGLLDTLNVWENQSLMQSDIKLQVSGFINGTKI
jgi:hypothetical protein